MRAYLSCLFDSATVTLLDKANRQMRDSDGSAMQAQATVKKKKKYALLIKTINTNNNKKK